MRTYIDVNGEHVAILESPKTIDQLVKEQIQISINKYDDQHFLLCDLGNVIKKYQRWREFLPRVKAYYAMKCFDELPVLTILRDLGASFDCASKSEMEKVLSLGVSPDRIIYAHPCKQGSMLDFARRNDVLLMTFDNESELHKIATLHSKARLVLRIRIESPYKGKIDLETKFGCSTPEVKCLLLKSKELQLNVVGISFHVGSNCSDERAFLEAIKQARDAFDIARSIGLDLNLLDIGGGFPGYSGSEDIFGHICRAINKNLDKYFPTEEGVEVIAEPGRYMVASACTLVVNVISKRRVLIYEDGGNEGERFKMMYYVNDGIYGSFLDKIVVRETYKPVIVKKFDNVPIYESSIWGPSCDSLDLIVEAIRIPLLEVGDWLYFQDMGAYTLTLYTRFNGMEKPRIFFYCQEDFWKSLYKQSCDNSGWIYSQNGTSLCCR